MGAFITSAITDSGRALLAKAQAGGTLEATRIVIGSGQIPAGKTAATMTDVVTPVTSLAINKKKATNDGTVIFGGVYSNINITENFYFRELGLKARVKYTDDSGNDAYTDEMLYAYGNFGHTADFMEAYSTENLVELQYDIAAYVGNDAAVNLTLESGIYVTEEQKGAPGGVVAIDGDGNADLAGGRICNLGAPTDPGDAVPLEYAKRMGAPVNLLDNSDFTNLVNQRGRTTYSKSKSMIDRWSANGSTSVQSMTFKITADGLKVTNTDNSMRWGFGQTVCIDPSGKPAFTAAVCDSDGIVYFATEIFDGITVQKIVNTDWGYLQFTRSSNSYYFAIGIKKGGTKTFRWAALYEGEYTAETLPEYRPKGYAAELAECQRYLVRYGVDGIINIAYALAGFETAANANIYTPVPMRDKPTYKVISGTPQLINGDTNLPITEISVNHCHHNILFLGVAVDSALTVGQVYALRLHDAIIEFSAEL